jgi:ssDNA thymidine ADP-ribosyltransferase, DarT
MLSWQPNPHDPEAFHITHVNNLPSIRANGLLCERRRRRRQRYRDLDRFEQHQEAEARMGAQAPRSPVRR